MSIQIHDEATLAALTAATDPQDVCAPDGRLLGQFVPAPKLTFEDFGVTVEELERVRTDPNTKWYTPDEVMARLREIDRCSP